MCVWSNIENIYNIDQSFFGGTKYFESACQTDVRNILVLVEMRSNKVYVNKVKDNKTVSVGFSEK